MFLSKPLSEIAKLKEIYEFTYSDVLRRAKTIDVIWFNTRKYPASFFEIEHSTDMHNSIIKFFDLQDFYSKFYIVSSLGRRKEFQQKLNYNIFKEIKERICFLDYNYISNLHTKTFELASLENI